MIRLWGLQEANPQLDYIFLKLWLEYKMVLFTSQLCLCLALLSSAMFCTSLLSQPFPQTPQEPRVRTHQHLFPSWETWEMLCEGNCGAWMQWKVFCCSTLLGSFRAQLPKLSSRSQGRKENSLSTHIQTPASCSGLQNLRKSIPALLEAVKASSWDTNGKK